MILHAVPSSINAGEYGAGNWKAVEANRLALDGAGIPWRSVRFDVNDPWTMLSKAISEAEQLFVEYSLWPHVLVQVRKKRPSIRVHVRTHNAEAYQHFHRTVNGLRDYGNLRIWRKCASILLRDARCRQAADVLLGISEWDNGNYWRFLPGKALIQYLPYYSPWPYLRPEVEPQPWNQREPIMLSMGGNFDPSGMANVENFDAVAVKFSRMLGKTRWSFLLTWWSQWHKRVPRVSEHVVVLRDCLEPWDLLCRVRALALLTPLGFGFKTTIVDGLAAGCHVIVHPLLARRLPLDVRELCLVCDPSKDEDVARIADSLSIPPRSHNINRHLREKAVGALCSTFA